MTFTQVSPSPRTSSAHKNCTSPAWAEKVGRSGEWLPLSPRSIHPGVASSTTSLQSLRAQHPRRLPRFSAMPSKHASPSRPPRPLWDALQEWQRTAHHALYGTPYNDGNAPPATPYMGRNTVTFNGRNVHRATEPTQRGRLTPLALTPMTPMSSA